MTNGAGNGGDDDATPTPTFTSQLPETDETVSPEVTPPPDVQVISPPPGFSAAVPGTVESECQLDSSAVVLTWQTAQPRGREQTVNLVSDFDDFVPGFYLSSQPLSSDTDSLTWRGLIPGVVYFWRVTTRIDGEWVASPSAQFQAEDCLQRDQARLVGA